MKRATTKTVHYISHRCGPQECDCRPRCFQREGDEIQTTSAIENVTCKNCLRSMAAEEKRKWQRYSQHIASCKAWADEVRGGSNEACKPC